MKLRGVSYLIALAVVALDQLSKYFISSRLELYEQIKVIGQFFVITSIRNTGAAFSILEGKRIFFLIITIAVTAGIAWFIHINRQSGRKLMLISLGLVLGGAVGNFIDRLLYGHVVDFLSFNFGSYSFPVFNLADSAITVGVILILLETFLGERRNASRTPRGA